MKAKGILRALGRPKLFIPTVLSLALLAFVLSIADFGAVRAGLGRLSPLSVAAVFLLAVGYLGLKGLQLHVLLRALGVELRPGQFVGAFAVGEMANTLPVGEYAQNWLMLRLRGARFATTAAATTGSLMFEGAVTLLGLFLLGIPGFPWLRPALGAFFALSLVWTSLLLGSRRVQRRGKRLVRRGRRLHTVGEGLIALLVGIRRLLAPRPLLVGGALSTAYLLLIAAAFLVVARAVGIEGFTWEQAVTAYFFGLAVTLLLGPISTQLGVLEASSLGALLAWGYGQTESLVLLLVFRLLWLASTWLPCLAAVILVRREYRTGSTGGDEGEEAPH